MALTQVVPVQPPALDGTEPKELEALQRTRLTKPSDDENELIRIAAEHGPPGVFACMRAHRDFGWYVALCLRAIEVCISPVRTASGPAALQDCDPVNFSTQLLELELIGELFEICRYFEHVKDVQRCGLAIVELLVMDDTEWRDEVARKGGVGYLCDVSKQWKDSPRLMCQVMMCMAYLAAENYIEVMLCQHEALEYVAYILRRHAKNTELITRTSLALLNLTVCEPHVEELMDKQALPSVVQALDEHAGDVHVVVILCGVLANLSVNAQAQELLVELGIFARVKKAMQLDEGNAVLQVACLKALVNYSTAQTTAHYLKMEQLDIPKLVCECMVNHPGDSEVQRFGQYFLMKDSSCFVM